MPVERGVLLEDLVHRLLEEEEVGGVADQSAADERRADEDELPVATAGSGSSPASLAAVV